MNNKANPSILITGCSTGIGYVAATMLKSRGYRVFATARRAEDVQRLKSEGFESLQLDLTDSESISTALDEVLNLTGGTLDALFNNGAYGQPGAVEDLRREILLKQFETNVFGTQELTNRVIRVMRKQGHGRIIYNSSVLGFVAFKHRGAYVVSKYAIEGLADTLRLELMGSNIHIVLIEPGPITSDFRKNAYKAFKDNIDVESSAFHDYYIETEKRLTFDGKGQFELPAERVGDKLIKALESPRPKARYYVTFPTYLFGYLKRILPTRALDWVIAKAE
mgnify:CR=1 FL=1